MRAGRRGRRRAADPRLPFPADRPAPRRREDRALAPPLARAAAAVGIDALFCEVHEDPGKALSDGPNSLTFPSWDALVADVLRIRAALAG